MKKLVIEVKDQDFPHLLGTLMKMSASFQVEHVDDAVPKPKRTVHKYAQDGRTTLQVLRDALRDGAGRVHQSNLRIIGEEAGFAPTTIGILANKMVREGRLERKGDHYVIKVGAEV